MEDRRPGVFVGRARGGVAGVGQVAKALVCDSPTREARPRLSFSTRAAMSSVPDASMASAPVPTTAARLNCVESILSGVSWDE
jgi:hypothetical protein